MALLVKLGWSKASNQDKVYVHILIAKYLCKEKTFQSSLLWKGIQKTKPLVKKFAYYQVLSVSDTNIKEDTIKHTSSKALVLYFNKSGKTYRKSKYM